MSSSTVYLPCAHTGHGLSAAVSTLRTMDPTNRYFTRARLRAVGQGGLRDEQTVQVKQGSREVLQAG